MNKIKKKLEKRRPIKLDANDEVSLQMAHRRGLLDRDLKFPTSENVFATRHAIASREDLDREFLNRGVKIGDRVVVAINSGVDSGRKGIVVSPREIKTDGRGKPTNVQGAYKPVDWNREFAIWLDDGSYITMPKNRVKLDPNPPREEEARPSAPPEINPDDFADDLDTGTAHEHDGSRFGNESVLFAPYITGHGEANAFLSGMGIFENSADPAAMVSELKGVSLSKLKMQYPRLIDRLNDLFSSARSSDHGIEEALNLIQRAGVTDETMTKQLLSLSDFKNVANRSTLSDVHNSEDELVDDPSWREYLKTRTKDSLARGEQGSAYKKWKKTSQSYKSPVYGESVVPKESSGSNPFALYPSKNLKAATLMIKKLVQAQIDKVKNNNGATELANTIADRVSDTYRGLGASDTQAVDAIYKYIKYKMKPSVLPRPTPMTQETYRRAKKILARILSETSK